MFVKIACGITVFVFGWANLVGMNLFMQEGAE
jgi:hypothetical protein